MTARSLNLIPTVRQDWQKCFIINPRCFVSYFPQESRMTAYCGSIHWFHQDLDGMLKIMPILHGKPVLRVLATGEGTGISLTGVHGIPQASGSGGFLK
jgi:hypothetical protein